MKIWAYFAVATSAFHLQNEPINAVGSSSPIAKSRAVRSGSGSDSDSGSDSGSGKPKPAKTPKGKSPKTPKSAKPKSPKGKTPKSKSPKTKVGFEIDAY